MSDAPVSRFIRHHYRHFNSAALVDAADAYTAPRRGRRHDGDARRGDEHRGARPLARRDDPARQGAGDHLHRRQPRGGRVQPGGARALRAHPGLPRPHRRRRGSAAGAASQPRHRHLHPGGGGHPPHRACRARALAGGRRRRQALFPARVHVPDPAQRQAGRALPDRSEGQLAAGRCREEPADHRAPAGKTRRWATSTPATASPARSRTCTRCAAASST
jgi:hypothetical protein